MRGEHVSSERRKEWIKGSPPHARGAPAPPSSRRTDTGITPACAGSTDSRLSSTSLIRDHPRMRGEHIGTILAATGITGSPPHARGAPLQAKDPAKTKGITPACAGSTRLAAVSAALAWDHPRMRGEHGKADGKSPAEVGSPPHARGAPFIIGERSLREGITPACAGST